jgi:hypothetical protein
MHTEPLWQHLLVAHESPAAPHDGPLSGGSGEAHALSRHTWPALQHAPPQVTFAQPASCPGPGGPASGSVPLPLDDDEDDDAQL